MKTKNLDEGHCPRVLSAFQHFFPVIFCVFEVKYPFCTLVLAAQVVQKALLFSTLQIISFKSILVDDAITYMLFTKKAHSFPLSAFGRAGRTIACHVPALWHRWLSHCEKIQCSQTFFCTIGKSKILSMTSL